MSKNEEMSTTEEKTVRIFMPELDGDAIQAVVSSYRDRADKITEGDVGSLTIRLELLKRAEKAEKVLKARFPDHDKTIHPLDLAAV